MTGKKHFSTRFALPLRSQSVKNRILTLLLTPNLYLLFRGGDRGDTRNTTLEPFLYECFYFISHLKNFANKAEENISLWDSEMDPITS